MSTETDATVFDIGLDFWVDLGEKVNGLCRDVKRSSSLLQPARYNAQNAVYALAVPVVPTLVNIPSTVGTGSPAIDRVWQVIRIALFGSDDHTAVSGVTASIFVGPVAGQEGSGAQSDLTSCIASNVTVPYINLIGKDRVWMSHGEAIYAWVYGTIPANQQFVLSVNVDDYPVYAKETMRI